MQKESHRLGLPDDYDYELIDAEFRMRKLYGSNPREVVDIEKKLIECFKEKTD